MSAPGAGTRVCAVIGAPIAHSLSPAMHNAAFGYLGLDFTYLALEVRDAASAIAGAAALGFAGLNVTAPYKEIAIGCCEPDELCRAVGAVNTIVYAGGGARGTNTDVHGFTQALASLDVRPRRAVIVGAGGAARAAIHVLAGRGVELAIFARRARSLRVGSRAWTVAALREQPAASLAQVFAQVDLLVDATPLGLGDAAPSLPIEALSPDAAVIDLVARRQTPIVRAAHVLGLRAETGTEMLLHQGAAAFTAFTGRAAPLEVMRLALERALGIAPRRARAEPEASS